MVNTGDSTGVKLKGKEIEDLEDSESCYEETESMSDEDDMCWDETNGGGGGGGLNFDEEAAINSEEDLIKVNMTELTSAKYVARFHFPDVSVAFMFYNWYASIKGFAARKCSLVRNCRGEVIQQTFVCYKEGHRRQKHYNREGRVKKAKPDTRCGCQAKCQVHVDEMSGRWYIKYLDDEHNHTLVLEKWTGMLPGHRKMNEHDKYQMNMMRSVGIGTSNIYGLFAAQNGGFDKVGFMKRDMYNEQAKQKKFQTSDATAVLDLLDTLSKKDDMFYWKHTVNEEGSLEQVFWCDGASRRDFSIFGDVLAFDATYKKNKYYCPLVVFSGVNHHNQSIVFAAAIVTDESEDTYVWLLETLLDAMGGKSPVSVITDGAVSMKNAIKRVFPNAHHRLCAWHLLRNAVSNIKDPKFVSRLRPCMLGDFDVDEFQTKWDKLVAEFGLEENSWVLELYEKKSMWAAAHIRGKFFAGFRTTSRCEGLHSEIGKYVSVKNNLVEFLEHFFRWLNYMRYREAEADFISSHGEPVLQTKFKCLEKSASEIYTREIFSIFLPILEKVYLCRVVGFRRTEDEFIYTVVKARKEGYEWEVSYSPIKLEFKCSCERLESLGIPCEHMLYIIWYLDIVQLPDCVVNKRWTKAAKDCIPLERMSKSGIVDPSIIMQYKGMVDRCHKMAIAALECGRPELVRRTFDLVTIHTQRLEAAARGEDVVMTDVDTFSTRGLQNRSGVRINDCGSRAPRNSQSEKKKSSRTPRKPPACSVCGRKGHNKNSCRLVEDSSNIGPGKSYTEGFEDWDYGNVDTRI